MSESHDWALDTLRQKMKWLEEVNKVLSIHQRSPFQQLAGLGWGRAASENTCNIVHKK